MKRFRFALLLALLAAPTLIGPSEARITPAQASAATFSPRLIANGEAADLGWTKQQVERQNGKPRSKSADGNTWHYPSSVGGDFVVHFNSAGKVDRVSGAA